MSEPTDPPQQWTRRPRPELPPPADPFPWGKVIWWVVVAGGVGIGLWRGCSDREEAPDPAPAVPTGVNPWALTDRIAEVNTVLSESTTQLDKVQEGALLVQEARKRPSEKLKEQVATLTPKLRTALDQVEKALNALTVPPTQTGQQARRNLQLGRVADLRRALEEPPALKPADRP